MPRVPGCHGDANVLAIALSASLTIPVPEALTPAKNGAPVAYPSSTRAAIALAVASASGRGARTSAAARRALAASTASGRYQRATIFSPRLTVTGLSSASSW